MSYQAQSLKLQTFLLNQNETKRNEQSAYYILYLNCPKEQNQMRRLFFLLIVFFIFLSCKKELSHNSTSSKNDLEIYNGQLHYTLKNTDTSLHLSFTNDSTYINNESFFNYKNLKNTLTHFIN